MSLWVWVLGTERGWALEKDGWKGGTRSHAPAIDAPSRISLTIRSRPLLGKTLAFLMMRRYSWRMAVVAAEVAAGGAGGGMAGSAVCEGRVGGEGWGGRQWGWGGEVAGACRGHGRVAHVLCLAWGGAQQSVQGCDCVVPYVHDSRGRGCSSSREVAEMA